VVRWSLNVSVPRKPLIFVVRISSQQWSQHLDHGYQRGHQPFLIHGDIRSFLVSIRELYRHREEISLTTGTTVSDMWVGLFSLWSYGRNPLGS
jgi:hypothetical protein